MIKPTIAIVTGGDSLEAGSSLASARNVYDRLSAERFSRVMLAVENWQWTAIQADGVEGEVLAQASVDCSDFSLCLPDRIIRFDGVFIALHGAPGETGHLQAWFELLGLPYTGSGMLTSAMAMDKRLCKRLVESTGAAHVPQDWIIPASEVKTFDPAKIDISYPLIVKPNSHGSGLGVSLVANPASLFDCAGQVDAMGQGVLVEEFVPGREFTVAAIIQNGVTRILPVAEVFRPDHSRDLAQYGRIGFTDRQRAQFSLTPQLDDETCRRLESTTRAVGRALGCRSFYRVDFMLRADGELFFLEVNTIPGMTERSVFTAQLRAGGLDESAFYCAVLDEALLGEAKHASRNL